MSLAIITSTYAMALLKKICVLLVLSHAAKQGKRFSGHVFEAVQGRSCMISAYMCMRALEGLDKASTKGVVKSRYPMESIIAY